MDCIHCLKENKESIEKNGYGYGFIPKALNCPRHTNNSKSCGSEWSWTDGYPNERSNRRRINMTQKEYSNTIDKSAYLMSLHDENTWESFVGSEFKVSNRREELADKMANRDMVQQIGLNPFLGNTNYVDDVSNRDQFLKPVNTTQGSRLI